MLSSDYNINIPTDYIEFKNLIIKKHKLHYQQQIPSDILDNIGIESIKDQLTQNLLIHFETYFASTEKTETKTKEEIQDPIISSEMKAFSKPRTWWDHFKLEYFPQWLLNKFPIELETESFEYTKTIINKTIVNNNNVTIKLCPHIKMKNDNECIKFLSN